MQANRFHAIRDLFDTAMELDASMREDHVRAAAGEDTLLYDEVMDLLRFESDVASHKTMQPNLLTSEALDATEKRALLGRRIGRYQILEELGAGGMGRVFKAIKSEDGVEQVVALKLLRRELFNTNLLKRFSTERQIMAGLNHPGIAYLIDAGADEDGTPFVAMEFVDGDELMSYCAAQKLSVRERLTLFRQILAAVAHAHQNLIVHRDLKPANILVTKSGQIKLLDFGIAKPLQQNPALTATSDRYFSPAYAAPEQLRGEHTGVTCDVYALGAVLYEMLTGDAPFNLIGLSHAEIERQILSIPPPSMQSQVRQSDDLKLAQLGIGSAKSWSRQLKGDLENVVQQALRKEPRLRYASVEQLDADIESFLTQKPVHASGAKFGYRAQKFLQRNAFASAALAAIALILLGSSVVVFQKNIEIRQERDQAKMSLDILRDAFRAADPTSVAGGDTRARDILRAASKSIEQSRTTNPKLYVDLASDIIEIQIDTRLFDSANTLAERAIESSKQLPTNSNSLDGLLLKRAKIMLALMKPDQAKSLLLQIKDPILKNSGEFKKSAGLLAYLEDNFDQAIGLTKEAIQLFADADMRIDWIYAHWQLARIYNYQGRSGDALGSLDAVEKFLGSANGGNEALVIQNSVRRIQYLSSSKNDTQVANELAKLVEMAQRNYGEHSEHTAYAVSLLGNFYFRHDDFAQALKQYRRSESSYLASVGANHAATLRTQFNIALSLINLPDNEVEADNQFKKVLLTSEATLNANDELMIYFRLRYVEYLLSQNNKKRALELLHPEGKPLDMERVSANNINEYHRLLNAATQ